MPHLTKEANMPDGMKTNQYLFQSARPGAFAFRRVAGRYWFSLAPTQLQPGYPLLVDLFDTDFSPVEDPDLRTLMQNARDLVAPRYELVKELVPDDQAATVGFEDIEEQESGFPNIEKLTLLAESMARLGPGFGLVVPSPEHLDADTESFVRYLVDASGKTGFGILWGVPEGSESAPITPGVAPLDIDRAFREPVGASSYVALDNSHEAFGLLSASGLVLPVAVFEALGFGASAGQALPEHGFVFAPYDETTDGVVACGELANRMPHEGFGYLRRHPLLLWGQDRSQLIHDHQIYRAGFSQVGREFLYHHYLALADAKDRIQGDSLGAAYARLSAARLAPRVAIRDGFSRAIEHFRTALECDELSALDRADTCQQLANVLAVRGGQQELAEAQGLYEAAQGCLEGQVMSERCLRIIIRIKNGRALIDYKSGRPDVAEKLEDEALRLADRYQADYPAIYAWANSLIKTNLATLHLRAYDDLPGCISLTSEVLSATEHLNDEQSLAQAVRLAALLAHGGRFGEASDLLARTFKRSGGELGEVEVFAVLLYASLLAQAGRTEEVAHLLRRHSLAIETVGADYAKEVATQLSAFGAGGEAAAMH